MEQPPPSPSPSSEQEHKKARQGDLDTSTMDVDDSSLIAATETETSSIQISLTSSTTEDSISDSDILMGLRPIVLLQQLKVHDDSALLCTSLKTLDFLQLPSLIHSKPKEVILKELRQIYRAARSREAEKCATDGDVAMNIREAAIEIRNAILHAELKCIHQESEMKVYQGLLFPIFRLLEK
jgi:hypothetical protein